jgi:hypothetical protein
MPFSLEGVSQDAPEFIVVLADADRGSRHAPSVMPAGETAMRTKSRTDVMTASGRRGDSAVARDAGRRLVPVMRIRHR